jgi:hypothetical protein
MKRKKGKSTASSANAVRLLQSSSKGHLAMGAASGFIGFERFANKSVGSLDGQQQTAAEITNPPEASDDGELNVILRRLLKKESVTRIKALDELKVLVGRRNPDEVKGILVHWAAVYGALMLSQSARVRTCANSAFAAMVQKVRKERKPLAGQLKKLMGPWWLSVVDNSSECAMLGERSLTSLFPGHKLRGVLDTCGLELLRFLYALILMTPLELSSKAQGNAVGGKVKTNTDDGNEMEERHARVTSTALLALTRLVTDLSDEANENFMEIPPTSGEASSSGSSSNAEPSPSPASTPRKDAPPTYVAPMKVMSYVEVFVNKNLWQLIAHRHSHVRHAMYRLVIALSNCKPIQNALPPHIQRTASLAVFNSFSEKEPANHATMFAAVITFTRAFPECWTFVNP